MVVYLASKNQVECEHPQWQATIGPSAPHQTLSALIQTCSRRRPRKSSFLAPGITDSSPPLLPTIGNVLEMLHDESPSRIPVMSFY